MPALPRQPFLCRKMYKRQWRYKRRRPDRGERGGFCFTKPCRGRFFAISDYSGERKWNEHCLNRCIIITRKGYTAA